MSFDAVYELSDVSDVLSLINPNAVICSDELTIPLSNEVRYEDVAAFNDVLICAFGTEVKYEPLSPSSESNLWSAEDVNVFSDVLICALGTEVRYEPLSDSKESNL